VGHRNEPGWQTSLTTVNFRRIAFAALEVDA
jgi:hypothetical protein